MQVGSAQTSLGHTIKIGFARTKFIMVKDGIYYYRKDLAKVVHYLVRHLIPYTNFDWHISIGGRIDVVNIYSTPGRTIHIGSGDPSKDGNQLMYFFILGYHVRCYPFGGSLFRMDEFDINKYIRFLINTKFVNTVLESVEYLKLSGRYNLLIGYSEYGK